MRVVDASVVVDLLTGDLVPDVVGEEPWAAPHLIDSEVTHVLRRHVLSGRLRDAEGAAAMDLFAALEFTRHPGDWLRARMWSLRHNTSAYDATYLALAETLGAAFLTRDARLATVPGLTCVVDVV